MLMNVGISSQAFVLDLSDSKSLAEGTVSFLSVASSPEVSHPLFGGLGDWAF